MIKSFSYGDYVFVYYRYLDKFHVEPVAWNDLFEFLQYNKIDSDIAGYIEKKVKEGAQ